ncbi:hypothetical protein HMPREF0454_01606 [Hafnia alvei ATCC 51873]|uniref:Uncharacterized protein n=1 Tax=Hafnia alvei ATCC 51873 TaxID=1002364 RepID=G9Y4U2_HAFAL|nr:hypothetical protein HMPREF0454_01606 [Hafnia alvei ATCC 51873]
MIKKTIILFKINANAITLNNGNPIFTFYPKKITRSLSSASGLF